MQILLVEDDPHLGATLKKTLKEEGYSCNWVTSTSAADSVMLYSEPDMLILDWMLPGESGIDFLARIRSKSISLPVLMLTARREAEDKVTGLDSGADDYLTKPFDLDELLARVRALSRRARAVLPRIVSAHNLTFNLNSMELQQDGQQVVLSKTELAIMEKLMSNPNAYVSKSRLLNSIYNIDKEISPNALEAHISRLRKRLGSNTIHTLRGIGYRIGDGS